MRVRRIDGTYFKIDPAHPDLILVELFESRGLVAGSIWVEESTGSRVTEGIVRGLPKDRSVIDRYYPDGLQIGDHILFSRWATGSPDELVYKSYDWETIEVAKIEVARPLVVQAEELSIGEEEVYRERRVYVLAIADVECVIGHLAPA